MKESLRPKVVRLPIAQGVGEMMTRIRAISKDTEKVFLTDHAVNRMFERGISDAEIFRALRFGEIRGGLWEEDDGEKACKVVMTRRGDRTIGVITILIDADDELVVKTVEWEDRK